MATVYGELDDAGSRLLVTVQGADDIALNQAAAVIQSLTPSFNPTSDPNVLAVPLSWTAATQLAHNFVTGELRWLPGARLCDWLMAEIIRRSCQGDVTGHPPQLTPMAHQSSAALAIGMNGRFLLADDMGTGKGGSYLMGLAELEARNRSPWPAALVCPAGVVDTLLEEIPLWYPQWKAVAYRGGGRAKYLKSNAQILVMGYETMRNDVGNSDKPGPLMRAKLGTVIFDECHALCNYGSLQSREARRLARHVANVIAGSGTPITRNVAGFWPILFAMYPDSYPVRARYKGHYTISRRGSGYGGPDSDADVIGLDPLRTAEFRADTSGVFRRVSKEDVLDLPGKTYVRRYVEIPAAWRAAYDQMEADMLAELPDSLNPLEAQVAIVKMMRLRQLACSACDVETWHETETNERSPNYGTDVKRTKVTLKEPCWKGAALTDILSELHEAEGEFDDLGRQHGHTVGSRPAIAFAESAQLVRVAGGMAEKKGYAVGYIDGSVDHATRKDVRLRFQANKLDLICVTTGTGGTGLNLTAADTVVFLARPWGYVPAVQAEDRAYRRGQVKPVSVIDIIAKNTVESRVLARLREKAGALADLVQDRRIVETFLGGSG